MTLSNSNSVDPITIRWLRVERKMELKIGTWNGDWAGVATKRKQWNRFLFSLCFIGLITITAIAQTAPISSVSSAMFVSGTKKLVPEILQLVPETGTIFWYQFSGTSFWSVCHGHNDWQYHNFVNMWFICTKMFRTQWETMLCECCQQFHNIRCFYHVCISATSQRRHGDSVTVSHNYWSRYCRHITLTCLDKLLRSITRKFYAVNRITRRAMLTS